MWKRGILAAGLCLPLAGCGGAGTAEPGPTPAVQVTGETVSPDGRYATIACGGRTWSAIRFVETEDWTFWDFTLPEDTFPAEDRGVWTDEYTLELTAEEVLYRENGVAFDAGSGRAEAAPLPGGGPGIPGPKHPSALHPGRRLFLRRRGACIRKGLAAMQQALFRYTYFAVM